MASLDFDARHQPCIFLTESWYPGDFDLLSECAGAIGTEGGRACHLALACRGLSKPAEVGASEVTLDRKVGSVQVGGRRFAGEFYALVDGTAGKVTFSDDKPSPVPVYNFEARVTQRDLQWIDALATDNLDRIDFDCLSTTSKKRLLELTVLVKRLRRDYA